jgi:colanic acid/amylovoran biosynthesis protein
LGPKLFELETASLLDKPIVFLPQTIEYIADERSRARLIRILNRSAVFCRDDASVSNVQRMGAAPRVLTRLPDLALLHERPWLPVVPGRGSVAICVRDWPHSSPDQQARYLSAIGDLVDHILLTGEGSVTFVSTCTGRPEYRLDDSDLADAILAEHPVTVAQRVTVDRRQRTTDQLIERLQDFDLVVSTRLHLAILALCGGVPCAAIDYENKAREAFARLGVEDWVIDYNDISSKELVRLVETVGRTAAARRDAVSQRLEAERSEAASLAGRLRTGFPEWRAGE